jgi:endonuclease/exonuclease/phosphatase family metal-dependent hydrolase
MKKSYHLVIVYGLLFLFLIQMAGTLVEAIYILDLLNTSLDAKALGLLFFFMPVLLIPFHKRAPGWMIWLVFGLLFIARGMTPYLDTSGRLVASGIGTGTALLLIPLLVSAKLKKEPQSQSGLWLSIGLAFAVGLSVLLRSLNFGLDYSLTLAGGWVGWVLGVLFGYGLTQMDWESISTGQANGKGVTSAVFGMMMVLTLVYFVFSAPGVLARWTEGNYALIVMTVSLLALCWAFMSMLKPGLLNKLPRQGLLGWNLLFTMALVGTTLAHRVPFPISADALPIVVGAPTWMQRVPLVLMLLTFPVIFMDVRVFSRAIQQANPTLRGLVPGMLLGSFALVLLVFFNIFTNVWGYIEPVSLFFRNKFWLPFALIAGIIMVAAQFHHQSQSPPEQGLSGNSGLGLAVLFGAIFFGTVVSALRSEQVQPVEISKSSLTVMTYNIQQANDPFGERSYERQFALIKKVSPDILALQEGDSARISLNNNDYVRYYASKLGYYSYYGPSTVTGTFGTAILSKFPVQNTRTVFSFSDVDEIGTAAAQINVDGVLFTIYCVHPDGSDSAKLAFAQTLLNISKDQVNVIALGDYNLRDNEEAYQMVNAVYKNAWMSVYPTGISTVDGVDMSGRDRIDHIFVSTHLGVRNPVYVLSPMSATDHPVHWAEVFWEK